MLEDSKSGKCASYTTAEAVKVRNSLMAVATLRLGRRTKELTHMTLDEVKNAEKRRVLDESFHIIEVSNQKAVRTGTPAPVAFEESEFKVLEHYIEFLRPKITKDKFSKVVFPPCTKLNSQSENHMSFSASFKILQKFNTSSGMKISSRSVRGSKVTSSRINKMSEADCEQQAMTMNHTVRTANRNYNLMSVTDSACQTLAMNRSHSSVVTPKKYSDAEPPSDDDISSVSSCSAAMATSTPNKDNDSSLKSLCESFDTSSDGMATTKRKLDDSMNETLMNLRTKKIKSNSLALEKEKQISSVFESIRKIVNELPKKYSLYTKTGGICIKPVTPSLPKVVLKLFTTKELRDIISAVLKE